MVKLVALNFRPHVDLIAPDVPYVPAIFHSCTVTYLSEAWLAHATEDLAL